MDGPESIRTTITTVKVPWKKGSIAANINGDTNDIIDIVMVFDEPFTQIRYTNPEPLEEFIVALRVFRAAIYEEAK